MPKLSFITRPVSQPKQGVRASLLSATAVFAIAAATIQAEAGITVDNGDVYDITVINGGVVSTDDLTLINGTVQNGDLTASESFSLQSGTISARLFGFGTLFKSTGGTVVLSGANAYSGGTQISAGTLRLEHSSALGFAIFPSVVEVTGGNFDLANAINIANQVVLDGADFDVSVASGSSEWSGAISELTTPQGLVKTGAGTLVLSGANNFSGATIVNGGTLQIAETSNVGFGDVSIDGATVEMIGPVAPGYLSQSVNTLTVTDGDLLLTIVTPPGPLGLRKITAVNGYNFVATTGNTSTISMVLGGNANMSVSGGGTVNLASLFTDYTGDVTLDGTKLTLGAEGFNANSITVSNGGTIDYSSGHNQYPDIILTDGTTKLNVDVNIGVQHGDISGAFGIEKTGAAALGYATAMSYTGLTKISAGYINLMNGLPGQYGSIAGDIAMNGGSLGLSRTDNALDLTGDISGSGQIFTDFAFGSGTLSGNNSFTGGIFLFGGTIRAGSSTAFGAGGAVGGIAGTTIDLNGHSLSIGGLTGSGTYDLGGQTLTLTGTGFATGSIFTAGNLTVANGANQGLSGVDLSAIATLTLDGTLSIEDSGNVAPQSILLGANGRLDLEFLSQAEYVAAMIGGAGEIFLDDSRLTLGTGDIDIALSSQISGGGGSLKKTGAGTLTLSGANTFDGGIALEQGTLRLASSGAAGTGPITTTGSVISYANGVNNSAPIVINSATTQLEVLTAQNATQSGVISELGGPRPLEKIGGGFLGLSATNTYTGLTTISGGRLQLIGAGTVSNTVNIVGFDSWLDFARSDTYTYGGVISGTNIAQMGSGTTILTGANTHNYTGIVDGTLRVSGAGTLGASNVTVSMSGFGPAPATLDLDGTTQNIGLLRMFDGWTQQVLNGTLNVSTFIFAESGLIGADLGGAATLVKNTAGVTTLSGTNTFSGQTTINGGTLILQGGNAIANLGVVGGSGGVLQIDNSEQIFALSGAFDTTLNANLLIDGTSSTTYSGVISGAGGLYHYGAGTLTLTGASTYGGGTTISGGTIILGGANGEVAGDVLVDSGATLEFNRSNPLSFGGVISGAGTVKQNNPAGAVTLTAANTLQGVMLVTNGTLGVAGAGTFGDGASVTLSASGSGATVDLGGTSKAVFRLGVDQGATVTGAAGSELSVENAIDAGFGSISVGLSGNAGLNKITGIGGNTVTLSGTNTFTGTTQVAGGTLVLQGGAALADTNLVVVSAGATLQVDAGETIRELINSGDVALGANTLTLNYALQNIGTVSGTDRALIAVQGATNSIENLGRIEATGPRTTIPVTALEILMPGDWTGDIENLSGAEIVGTDWAVLINNLLPTQTPTPTVNFDGRFRNQGTISGSFGAWVNEWNGDWINNGTMSYRALTGSCGSLCVGGNMVLKAEVINGDIINTGTMEIIDQLPGGFGGAINIGSGSAPWFIPSTTIVNGNLINSGTMGTAGVADTAAWLLAFDQWNGIIRNAGTGVVTGANTNQAIGIAGNYISGGFTNEGSIVSRVYIDVGQMSVFSNAGSIAAGTGFAPLSQAALDLRVNNLFSFSNIGSITDQAGTALDLQVNSVAAGFVNLVLIETTGVGRSAVRIRTDGGSGTFAGGLDNSGTIRATASGTALSIERSISGVISNSGTLEGGVALNLNSSAGFEFLNSGSLTGDVDAQNGGTDTLRFTGGSLTGSLSTDATDILSVEGGSWNFGTQTIGELRVLGGNLTGGAISADAFNVQSGTIAANLSGAGGLTKTTSGTVTLSGTNAYTGQTTINGGTLVLQGGSAIDDASLVIVGGGTLSIEQSEAVRELRGFSGTVSIASGQTLTVVRNSGGFAGLFGGVMSGDGGLKKTGTLIEEFILSGVSTYTGGTEIAGGSLILVDGGDIAGDVNVSNASGEFRLSKSSAFTFGGIISGFNFRKDGVGPVTLTGINTHSYTRIDGGVLAVAGGGTLGGSGVTVDLAGNGAGATLDLAGGTQNIDTLRLNVGFINSVVNGTLNVATLIQADDGTISANLTGTAGLTKSGAATMTLSGVNTYSGPTTVNGSTLALQGGAAIEDTNSVTVNVSGTLRLDGDEAIGSLAGGGNLALTTKTLTTGGDNTDTLWTGTIFGGATSGLQKVGTGKFSVVGDMNHESTTVQAGELNFNGTALGNIAVNAGAKLSGTNTINGNLINLGTVASGNSPGTTTVLGNYTGGGTLDVEVQFDNAGSPINGTTHDFLDIAGNVLGAPTAINLLTFAPSGSPAATTGNGIEIVRVGGTSTAGDFTMTSYLLGSYYYNLAYLSNYIGGTVDSFFLQSSLATPGCSVDNTDNACFIDEAANLLGTPVDALAGNDTLQLNGATDFTFDVARIGTTYTNFEVFQKADANTVTLTGTMADANQGVDIQNGKLIAGSGTLGAQGRVNVFTPGSLQVAGNLTIGSIAGSGDVALGSNTLATGGDNTSTLFSGVVSGSGVLQKDGAGTLTLSGANTHTGQTSLQDGGITIAGSGTLGAATVGLFVQGTLDLGGTSQTVGSLGMSVGSIQNGALIVNGNGFAQDGTISADLTVTGNFSKAFGSGNLTLSGNNTLSSVGIGSGTLIAANDQAITDTASVNMSYIGFGVGPSLQILSNQTIGGLSGDMFSGLNLGAFRLTTGGNNASTSFDGVISSTSGKLVKTGTGTLTLSGNNIFSFAGGIDLMQGTLRLANDTAAGTGPITTFGSVIDYANGINSGAPVIVNSATTQFQVTTGSATQSGTIGELGGPRPFEKIGAGELVLSGTNTYTGATTISAGTLTVQGGAAIADVGAMTVSSGATLNLATSETVGSLTGGAGSAVTLGANALTTGGNGASTSFDGVISGAGGKLVKTGAGVFTLTGTNTFSGGIDLAQGTLRLGSNGAAGTGPITTQGAVVIDYATLITNAAPIVLGSNGTQVQVATFATQSGVISETGGARGLEKIGFGTLALTAANTYTGLTTVSQGRLQLIGNGALAGNVQLAASTSLIFDRTTPYTYSGVISGAGGITQGQLGTITLTGANTHASTTVGLGTLRVTGAGTLGASNAQVIVFGVGSTLDLGGTTQTIGSIQLSQDASNSVINGTLNVTTSILTTDGTFGVNLGGTAGLTKSGTGTVILSGANTYSGATTILDGTLRLQGGAAIADLGTITVTSPGVLQLANSETVGSVGGTGNVVLGANTLTLGGNNASTTLSGVVSGVGGKLVKQGSGMLTLSGANTFTGGIDVFHGTLTLGSNTAAGTGPITTFGTVINYLNLVNNAAPIVISSNTTQLQQIGGTATQSGPISEVGGPRPLEKIGNGNLTLSGANTFTGPMTISDGMLTLQGGAALADGVAVIVTAPGALALNTSETVGSLAGSGNLTMSAGTALTAGGTNASTVFSGNMTGGGFTKNGSGDFTFTGAGVFSGPLNVNAGTFTKTGGGMSGASAFNVASGATAFLGATTAGANGAGIAATGMGTVGVNGTLYLDDNSTVSGSTLTLGTGSTLGVFLTTNTSVYPQISVSGAANVAGSLGVYLDPLSFGSTLATTFNYDNVILGGSRSGTFGAVNLLQSPSGLFSVSATYGANDVDLTVTRSSFALLGGGGGNAPEVGGAVEDIFVIGTTDPDLLNLISTIGSSPPSAIAAIYAAISGSTSAETSGGGLRTDDPWKQTVAERINAARAPGCTVAGETWCLRRYAQGPSPVISDVQGNPNAFDWLDTGIRDTGTASAWLRAVGSWSAMDSSAFAPGSSQTTGGLIGGVDHVFDSLLLAGVAGQYLETRVDFDESRNKSHVRSAQLGAYMSYGGAEAYVNANASVIGTQARSERFATVGLLNYEIDSFMRGFALTASAEAGTILEADGFRFEPSIGLNYQYGMTGDYAERGGGGLSLLVKPDDSQSLRSTLTARLSRVIDIGDRKIVPQIRLDWRHEHLDRGQSFQAAFAGAPNVLFEVEGTDYARDQVAVGAGITVPLAGRLTGYADALGAYSKDTTSGTVLVGVRATW